MRSTSDAWRLSVRYSHAIVTTVESWLDGELIAASVPVVDGSIDMDDTGVLKRKLTLTVPARTPGARWDPAGRATAALANYGQRLHVMTGIRYPNRAVEVLDLGWYLITAWDRIETDGTIKVDAADLAALVVDDQATGPLAPPPGATFATEFHRLMNANLPTAIDPALADRPVPATVVWNRDRGRALTDLCDAWPARWRVDDTGTARAEPPYGPVSASTPPDLVVSDGADGVVVSRARSADRTALFNITVVDGKAGDAVTPTPHAVAEITGAGSPIRVTGPFGRRPQFYASDLITTQAEADSTAAALLVANASVGRSERVEILPDPSIELGDVLQVFTRDGDVYTARVATLQLPLTASGSMSVGPSMLPGGTT
jgi:Domain of unknown function (DUF5047)